MIRFEPVDFASMEWREDAASFADGTIYQHPAWISFVAEAQRAKPVVARLIDGNSTVGYFTGLTVRRLGLTLLGSPFPGWSTSYMGFNLRDGVSHRYAMEALTQFAFRELRCAHVECMDRNVSMQDAPGLRCEYNIYRSFELDLRPDEKKLLSNMAHEKRTNLRKADKNELTVEEARDEAFADEYYAQLCEVFHRQGLSPSYSLDRVRSLIRHLLPTGKLLLLRVRDPDGRCIATNLSLGEKTRGHVWGAASWHQYQILRPNELMFWYTFRYWKARGVEFLDLTGNSDYKARYGAYPIQLPWFHKSRYPLLSHLRDSAKQLVRLKHRLAGRWSTEAETPAHAVSHG